MLMPGAWTGWYSALHKSRRGSLEAGIISHRPASPACDQGLGANPTSTVLRPCATMCFISNWQAALAC